MVRLLAACQKKDASDMLTKERALVPFFDVSETQQSSVFEPLQQKARHGKTHRNVESESQQSGKAVLKKENAANQSSKQRKGSKKNNSTSTVDALSKQEEKQQRKHHRDPSYRNLGTATARPPSPPRKRAEVEHAVSTPQPPPSRFAGPAFTISPGPDALPIPTSTLLTEDVRSKLLL